jgi:hypothetical protein
MYLLTYLDHHDVLIVDNLFLQYPVAVDATPGRDVVEHPGVGAQGFDDVTR